VRRAFFEQRPLFLPALGSAKDRHAWKVRAADRSVTPEIKTDQCQAVPVSGEIHVRDYVPRDESRSPTLLGRKAENGQTEDGFAESA